MVVVLVSDSKVIPSFCGSLSLDVGEVGVSRASSKTIDEVDLSSLGETSFKVFFSP